MSTWEPRLETNGATMTAVSSRTPATIRMLRMAASILRRPFDMVDDDHGRRLLGTHEPKSELFAECRKQRRAGVVGGGILNPFEGEIIFTAKAGVVAHHVADETTQDLDQPLRVPSRTAKDDARARTLDLHPIFAGAGMRLQLRSVVHQRIDPEIPRVAMVAKLPPLGQHLLERGLPVLVVQETTVRHSRHHIVTLR